MNYPEIEEERQALVEEGIIGERDRRLVFIEDYIISPKRSRDTALSSSASLILHGNRNGWERWKNAEGITLMDIKEILDIYEF